MGIFWKTVGWTVMAPIWLAALLVAAIVYLALCAIDLYRFIELRAVFRGDRDAQERVWTR